MAERHSPCLSVGYTGCKADGHIPWGPLWTVQWLPKGYGPSMGDRLVCAFFDTGRLWDDYGVSRSDGTLPPLIRVAVEAMEAHLRQHPEDLAGHRLYKSSD